MNAADASKDKMNDRKKRILNREIVRSWKSNCCRKKEKERESKLGRLFWCTIFRDCQVALVICMYSTRVEVHSRENKSNPTSGSITPET